MESKNAIRRKFHYIYKTICLVTGKYYIGMHSTDNLQDGYKGSGKVLWYSIRKYGKENHSVEILEFVSDRKLLILREEEIVTKEIVSDPMCMNIREGGKGGWDHLTKEQLANASKLGTASFKEKMKDPSFNEDHRNKTSDGAKASYKNGRVRTGWNVDSSNAWTEKVRQKRAETRQARKFQQGENNSQHGIKRAWVNKDSINKKIKRELLESFLNDGWSLGIWSKSC